MFPALVIIANDKFQDVELAGTEQGLRNAGFDIVLASVHAGECRGKFGGIVQAALALSDIDVDAFDRVAFIGGPGARTLQENPDAHRIARETLEKGKVLGAICIAPTILARAGVLNGKKATVWNEDGAQDSFIENEGAVYTGDDVTIDGLVVTGNGPEAAAKFGKAFAELS